MRLRKSAPSLTALLVALFLAFSSASSYGQILEDFPVPSEDKKEIIVNFIEKHPELTDKFYDLFRVMTKIRNSYVDEKTYEEILNFAMKGTIRSLDQYGYLLIGDEASRFVKSTSGDEKFFGIGVGITEEDGFIVVTKVYPDSPALQAKMVEGDIILQVDDKNVFGLGVEGVANLIRGKENTQVSIIVRRKSGQEPELLIMTRKEVTMFSVEYKNLSDSVAYIKINSFGEDATALLNEVLQKSAGSKKLIIDLRNNPGGLVKSVKYILSSFLEDRKPIIIEKNRNGILGVVYTERQPNQYIVENDVEITVLINNFSASASEIFAGNMQYYKRAKIIGIRTYGKATVQEVRDFDIMPHDSVENTKLILGLTIARYYLPDDRDISREGVKSDIEIRQPNDFKAYEDLTERDLQFQEAVKYLTGNSPAKQP